MNEIIDEEFLEREPEKNSFPKVFSITRILLLFGFIIAGVVSLNEIESILISGPILSLIGIVLIFLSYKRKNKLGIILGLIPIVVSASWLVIIVVNNLSPSDCETIVPTSIALIVFIVLILDRVISSKAKNNN